MEVLEKITTEVHLKTWLGQLLIQDVLHVEHLLREFRDRESMALQGTARRNTRQVHHEVVELREKHEVDGKLPQIAIQLAWESEARRQTADRSGHEMVHISAPISRCGSKC